MSGDEEARLRELEARVKVLEAAIREALEVFRGGRGEWRGINTQPLSAMVDQLRDIDRYGPPEVLRR